MSEEIKNKLFHIESLLEKNEIESAENELSEIKNLLDNIEIYEKNWIIEKINELEDELNDKKNNSILKRYNKEIDSYLTLTIDNLSSLKEQRKYVNLSDTKLGAGKGLIGDSVSYLKNLKIMRDKDFYLFLGGFVFLVILIFVLWASL